MFVDLYYQLPSQLLIKKTFSDYRVYKLLISVNRKGHLKNASTVSEISKKLINNAFNGKCLFVFNFFPAARGPQPFYGRFVAFLQTVRSLTAASLITANLFLIINNNFKILYYLEVDL